MCACVYVCDGEDKSDQVGSPVPVIWMGEGLKEHEGTLNLHVAVGGCLLAISLYRMNCGCQYGTVTAFQLSVGTRLLFPVYPAMSLISPFHK